MVTPRVLARTLLSAALLSLGIAGLSEAKTQKKTPAPSRPTASARTWTPTAQQISAAGRVTRMALSYRGVRYRYGGASRRGTDCSGLMLQVFAKEGLRLPHNARAQFRLGKPISMAGLQPGDLVFFNLHRKLGHVGLYIGEGRFVHASTPRTGVRIDSIVSGTYRRSFAGARRLIATPKAPANSEPLPASVEPLLQQESSTLDAAVTTEAKE
ncbi:MAG TPA: C40 family peptidase [Armatimonadota bacterium]|jgi:cell wall-associated NlpC family hydrolase